MALRTNQVYAVQLVINYMVKYQNNYVSSFLFKNNFKELIEKGIKVDELMSSNIFCFQFDFDEWPSTHFDSDTFYKPFNKSLFELRHSYKQVFHEEQFQISNEDIEEMDSRKLYKVSYKINMISQFGEFVVRDEAIKYIMNPGESIMQQCVESDQLEIFNSPNFQDLILFKWQKFGRNLHLVGCAMHFFYVGVMSLYVYVVYIQNSTGLAEFLERILLITVVYPFVYDSI